MDRVAEHNRKKLLYIAVHGQSETVLMNSDVERAGLGVCGTDNSPAVFFLRRRYRGSGSET